VAMTRLCMMFHFKSCQVSSSRQYLLHLVNRCNKSLGAHRLIMVSWLAAYLALPVCSALCHGPCWPSGC
jgi:hypothetical protein